MWRETRIPLPSWGGQACPVMGKPAKQTYVPCLLRRYREHHGYKLREVAKAIQMTTSNLGKIERGTQPYTQGVLERAARFYNVDTWDLLMTPPGTEKGLPEAFAGLSETEKDEALKYVEFLRARRTAA